MSDELLLPQVPEPKPEDPEDVSWALSTAEAMWARGDHSEGVKWVRRAAEAAADAENDERSLELAKAAADLAGLVSKRGASRASIHIDDSELGRRRAAASSAAAEAGAEHEAAARRAEGRAESAHDDDRGENGTEPAARPTAVEDVAGPPPALGARPAPGKPLGTNTGSKSIPPPGRSSAAKVDDKKARKSKANLEEEAKAAFPPPNAFPAPDTSPDPIGSDTQEAPVMRRPEIGNNDPTFVGNVTDVMQAKTPPEPKRPSPSEVEDRSADEWDASPTQNLTGDELGLPGHLAPDSGDRKTALALPKPDFKSTVTAFSKPKASEKTTNAAPTSRAESHDPSIVTTQAVRVVVWRDGNGVHVAPQGTVVSAITVDAVLVALDSNADLTAWLTTKGR